MQILQTRQDLCRVHSDDVLVLDTSVFKQTGQTAVLAELLKNVDAIPMHLQVSAIPAV